MPHDPKIVDAIQRNDLEELKKYLPFTNTQTRSINDRNDNLESYFHVAVKEFFRKGGHYSLQLLEFLLTQGIDPSLQNRDSKTALEMINLNFKENTETSSPLFRAIHQTLPLLLAAMIKAGANLFVGYSLNVNDPNPLCIAMSIQLEAQNKRDMELSDRCKQCVDIILDNQGGFGVKFTARRAAAKIIDFSNKVMLGAIVDEQLVKDTPSLRKAVITFKQLEKYISKKYNLPADALNELRIIKLHAELTVKEFRKNKDTERQERMEKIVKELESKWPALSLADTQDQAIFNKQSASVSSATSTLFLTDKSLSASNSAQSAAQSVSSTGEKPPRPPAPLK